MATFVAEMYVPRGRAGERVELDRRAHAAATALSAEGTPVRHLRSVFVPEDEMCLHFFEAPATDAVAEVSRRAGFSFERIVEAIDLATIDGASPEVLRLSAVSFLPAP